MLEEQAIKVGEDDECQSDLQAVTPRQLLFLSHATPEDNDFVTWLATQLVTAGYEVWCDATELLGGERFWSNIGEAIDQHAAKVLFASTIHSNTKQGALRELGLTIDAAKANGIKDFLIPLKVDEFPFESTDRRLHDLNFVRFDIGWSHGLKQLLEVLERENVPKSLDAGPNCVADWYRKSQQPNRKVVVSNEPYMTNWLNIEMPDKLYFHKTRGTESQLEMYAAAFPYPVRAHGEYLVSFANSLELTEFLGPKFSVERTIEFEPMHFADKGSEEISVHFKDASRIVTDMLRQSWEKELTDRKLLHYPMSSGMKAWFFPDGLLEKNKAKFVRVNGKKTYRQLVGLKSKRLADGTKVRDGFWHYAVSASPQLYPWPHFVVRHHVLFTDDGSSPWDNADRMHRARRKVCKNWWNPEWRDRLLAFYHWFKADEEQVLLPTGGEQKFGLGDGFASLTSPWSYYEGEWEGLDETQSIELVEEEEAEVGEV